MLTVKEVASRLRYSVAQVYALMRRGELEYLDHRPYRIFPESVDAFIERHRRGPKKQVDTFHAGAGGRPTRQPPGEFRLKHLVLPETPPAAG